MSEHLAALLRSELTSLGVPMSLVSEWQTRFSQVPSEEWGTLLEELRELYSGEFDKGGRIASFIRSATVKMITEKEDTIPEPPEELVEALTAVLKNGKSHVVFKNDSTMPYVEVIDALAKICETRLNTGCTPQRPSCYKLPFLITQSDTIIGQVVSQTMSARRSIPLLTVWASQENTVYQFFGTPQPKGYKRIAQLLDEFYIFKMRTTANHDVFLFSKEPLEIVPCRIVGMRINATDFIKVGEMAKLSSSVPCYFVHTQQPEVRRLTEAEFKERMKSMNLDSLIKSAFGAYRQPPWFEKLMIAWMLGSKYSGYPLHLAVLSPAGVGKTFMMEGLAALTQETLASGSNDTVRGLVPSFGNGIPREGYLATCKRFAFLDEFFAMIKKSNNQNRSETDSGTYLMLEMLEHKDREVRSGVGSIRVKPRMKVLLVANSKAYNNMKTLVEVTEALNYAFLSRFMWYCLTPEHKQFIAERKSQVALLDREQNSPHYDPAFLEVVDYLSEIRVQGIDIARLVEIQKKYREFIPAELAEKVYDPRADHHLLCLMDGFVKLNSIIEGRPSLSPTDKDYEEVEKVFGDMVISWDADIDIRKIPERNRVSYLTERQKKAYDFIEARPGISTPDINMHLGTLSGEICRTLEAIGVVKTVVDIDGVTKLWYPHWAHL